MNIIILLTAVIIGIITIIATLIIFKDSIHFNGTLGDITFEGPEESKSEKMRDS